MSQQITIREMRSRGFTVTEISRDLRLDPKTVRKYLAVEDFSPPPPGVHKMPSKLDPYKPIIDEWLQEDEKVFYKQRHTARRIKARLE
ncbi:MAG: IS21 family transposase, partial [Coriobacteriia bacterium]|nr:IS21 family transposase [Coriobacteriia bacterium]